MGQVDWKADIGRYLNAFRYTAYSKSGVNVFGFLPQPEEEDVKKTIWSELRRAEREVWRQVWVWVETWMEWKLGWRPLNRSTWTLPEQSAIMSLEREPFAP